VPQVALRGLLHLCKREGADLREIMGQ
jgi:hypothetical protein